ncbi:hypothetical protein [Bombiscardovia coagulans]|uniref:Glycosyltransferase 2-like domain-containing protein n=1 Tax=Bombiscardovia coagulans TaxID=686666 RepID=A0A261ET24_9BIFI|nr:hypothetical protein [Bombiscardovia coagulans]OZG50022.1 hypothetical protein BOCO_0539 [Bombiscardovia coagulans]
MSSSSSNVTDVKQVLADVLRTQPLSSWQEVDSSIAAVVTVETDLTYFPETLAAVFAQKLLPGSIIIADCSGSTSQPLYSQVNFDHLHGQSHEERSVSIEIVRAYGATSFADAIRRALEYAHLPAAVNGIWLLHDDSKPLDGCCLESLVETWHDTPTASLLGSKQLDWEGNGLHNVGYYADKGRVSSLVVDGEPDQEQYDSRQDVFAVSLSGALLPLHTLRAIPNLGTWVSTFGQSEDFSRRVCLSGGRVVVVPSARIGHRRARYEGMRTKSGQTVSPEMVRDSSMQVIDARESFLYANHSPVLWPLIWLLRLVGALWFAVVRLINKQPYAAVCELCSPWRVLARLGKLLSARQKLRQVSNTANSKLEPLQVTRQQVKQWRLRLEAYEDQLNHPLLNNLARAHLRSQQKIRIYWACAVVAVACIVTGFSSWSLLKDLFTGGILHSEYLLGSAANMSQLAEAATIPWSWGLGVGSPTAPTPFFLLLLPVAVITGGNVSAAVALLFFACIPLAVLSFWALAGIFTRSNPIRAISSLLWLALAFALPVYSSGDLPNMVVMAFLPAAFAFTFRAVGMYYTDPPAQPHPSVRNAACAAVCFAAVVMAEPQLLLALIVVFLLFIALVGSHRAMLILIPLPAALAMAPTLVNTLGHWAEGTWRQLFADVTVSSPDRFGSPRSASIADIIGSVLGYNFSGSASTWLSTNSWQAQCLLVSLAVIFLIALVSLCLPSVARVSRLMWFLSIVGAILAVISTCVAVGQGWTRPAAGSPLPGLLLAMLGLLSCVVMMAGGAVRPFETLNVHRQSSYHAYASLDANTEAVELAAQAQQALVRDPALLGEDGKIDSVPRAWSVQRIARASLSVVLLITVIATAFGGLSRMDNARLRSDGGGLPMVAVDYLSRSDRHRVLAVRAHNDRQISYTMMRTERGDIVDVSASAQALKLGGRPDQAEQELSAAVAALMASPNSSAIETMGRLGIGGIFIPSNEEETGHGTKLPTDVLSSNITASDGTQQVVSGPTGTYFRLTTVDASKQGLDLAGQHAAAGLWWRVVWLWSLWLTLLAYALVALPRWRIVEGRLS